MLKIKCLISTHPQFIEAMQTHYQIAEPCTEDQIKKYERFIFWDNNQWVVQSKQKIGARLIGRFDRFMTACYWATS
jgi:hypothetical protein